MRPLPDGSVRPGKALPEIDGKLQIGIRYVLFQGDLDLDAAIRARAWTSFESRTLHAPTGHFALQELSPLEIGQSGTLDIFIKGGIRTATLFLSVENLLSGLAYHGVMLVPVYPFPARAFRFGVHWPLRN